MPANDKADFVELEKAARANFFRYYNCGYKLLSNLALLLGGGGAI